MPRVELFMERNGFSVYVAHNILDGKYGTWHEEGKLHYFSRGESGIIFRRNSQGHILEEHRKPQDLLDLASTFALINARNLNTCVRDFTHLGPCEFDCQARLKELKSESSRN